MKVKTLKKENGGPARTFTRISSKGGCFKGGFALLFSVLVSSLLLTMGLSVLNISLKELAISTASKQSIHAYYAADSGREYAIYLDKKVGWGDSPFFDVTSTSTVQAEPYGIINSDGTLIFPVDSTDPSGPGFSVNITKAWVNPNVAKPVIITTIDSIGHNSDGGDRIEREIIEEY